MKKRPMGLALIALCLLVPLLGTAPVWREGTFLNFSNFNDSSTNLGYALELMWAMTPLVLGLVLAWKTYWRFVASEDRRAQVKLTTRVMAWIALVFGTYVGAGLVVWAYEVKGILDFSDMTYGWSSYIYYGIAQLFVLIAARLTIAAMVRLQPELFPDGFIFTRHIRRTATSQGIEQTTSDAGASVTSIEDRVAV